MGVSNQVIFSKDFKQNMRNPLYQKPRSLNGGKSLSRVQRSKIYHPRDDQKLRQHFEMSQRVQIIVGSIEEIVQNPSINHDGYPGCDYGIKTETS